MATILVRKLPDEAKERLRKRAMRRKRSLEAEVRSILERAAQEAESPDQAIEGFPDWFIRMTRPGIDLDPALEENRRPHAGIDL
jgi:Antitoxin FitA-like, ribbon-helix-helix